MPIANNIDYGVLSRINVPLEQPSELEVMLMSTVRLCHMATEVTSRDGKGGLKSIPRVAIKVPIWSKRPNSLHLGRTALSHRR